jgi:hypothetical protein
MKTLTDTIRVQARFEIRPDGTEPFQLRIPDIGYRARTASTAGLSVLWRQPGTATGLNAWQIEQPAYLNGSGKPVDTLIKASDLLQPVVNDLASAVTTPTSVWGSTVTPFTIEDASPAKLLRYVRYKGKDLRGLFPGFYL